MRNQINFYYYLDVEPAEKNAYWHYNSNNEIEISAKIKGSDKTRYQVYLKIGEVEFANRVPSGIGSCGGEQPAVYLGKIYFDESVKTAVIPRALPSGAAQKQNAPFVQRERNSMIIRDGEKRYRMNGAKVR